MESYWRTSTTFYSNHLFFTMKYVESNQTTRTTSTHTHERANVVFQFSKKRPTLWSWINVCRFGVLCWYKSYQQIQIIIHQTVQLAVKDRTASSLCIQIYNWNFFHDSSHYWNSKMFNINKITDWSTICDIEIFNLPFALGNYICIHSFNIYIGRCRSYA